MNGRVRTLTAVAAMSAVALGSAACSGGTARRAADRTTPTATTSTATSTGPGNDATVWLCRPGAMPDPCVGDLTTTAIRTDGRRVREAAAALPPPNADCFYVYPTVSTETSANADLTVGPEETEVAVAQAARFSTACRVWAPVYRQRTIHDLLNLGDSAPSSQANAIAFASVRSAWEDYLAHDNGGRPVVLIGHSQGAAMLIRLIRSDIDPNPSVRRLIALAILLGGNVTVPLGRTVGGSFQHLPLCTHAGQRGCVIAYSSFPGQPPSFALFGRPGFGVSLLSGEVPRAGLQVACVNPAAIGGGVAALRPYLPRRVVTAAGLATPWVSFPGRYTAQCRSGNGATWLQVNDVGPTPDRLLQFAQRLGPAWGYHLADVNLALGDLVADVSLALHRGPVS